MLIKYIISLIASLIALFGLTSIVYALDTNIPSIFLLNEFETNNDTGKAQQWFLNHDPRDDIRTDGTKVIKDIRVVNGNTTIAAIKPDDNRTEQVRIDLFAGNKTDLKKNLASDKNNKPNHPQLSKQGFMFQPNDWHNVEITEYIKVNELGSGTKNGGKHIELQARSGIHSSGYDCQGTSYHFNVYDENGRVKLEKEFKHSDNYMTTKMDPEVSHIINNNQHFLLNQGWIGIKMVVYDVPNGVRIEGYLNIDSPKDTDPPTNNWIPVINTTDTGDNWKTKDGKGVCPTSNSNTESGRLINWGGPIVIFRSDNLSDYEWKWASVREIVAENR
jgi:hypothetical protein